MSSKHLLKRLLKQGKRPKAIIRSCEENLAWMHREMAKIGPGDYVVLDASNFAEAMRKADELDNKFGC